MRFEQLEIIQQDLSTSLEGSLSALEPLRGGCLLVTGGTGFVGTWLAETVAYLNDQHGFDLRCLLMARNTELFSETMTHLTQRPEFEMVRNDVRNVRDLPEEVTWIIHAGATPDNRTHNTDPLRTADTIVSGTKAVLEAAIRLPRLDGFLNVSSGLVYGPQPPDVECISEDHFYGFDPSAFGAVYAESKRLAETLCFAYANQQRIRVVNARPFAFIGPYQHLDRPWAINNFIRDSLHGGPVRILGDGETVRSYMYPSDMAVWMLAILASGQSGESYNVGSSQAITLSAAAEAVTGHFSPPPKIIAGMSPARQTGHSRFVPNTARAQSGLGLKLSFHLAASLRRTLQWNAT
ncbi:MAG: NAD-dependent epimerase/dehydratase family protein [Janthinobacterium lividum]